MIGQQTMFAPEVTLPPRRRVQIQIVSVAQARHILETFHYLHRCRTGRQVNYSVAIDGMVDGIITYAYPMTSAPIDGVPSGELLEFARLYLHRNIPHSASCAVAQSLKRIRADWGAKFPDAKPVNLVVSWSDTEFHKGTIYKAANFTWLRRLHGWQGGARKQGAGRWATSEATENDRHDKDCWIFRWSR